MRYEITPGIDPQAVAQLRYAVGWNRMEAELRNPALSNTFEIGCWDETRLIGYLCVVSNRVTDAYIQDVMVAPRYQGQGIGTKLMEMAIARLREMKVYMISVIYGEAELRSFYERFGFHTMLCGQLENEIQDE